MYLENIKDIETKKGFIAQILTISKLYDKIKNRGDYSSIYSFFPFRYDNICTAFIKGTINELSNNDKEVEYELNEIQESFNNYIQHIKEANNEIDLQKYYQLGLLVKIPYERSEEDKKREREYIEKLDMFEKVWQKYSKHIGNEEIKIKKSIYFELYAFAITLDVNLDFYFKLIKNKLNLSENTYKEIENIIQCNASIYKSISDIINIG